MVEEAGGITNDINKYEKKILILEPQVVQFMIKWFKITNF